MKKCSLKCPVCSAVFYTRVKRNWFIKNALFFLPIKVYYCDHCEKNVYVLVSEKLSEDEILKYKPAYHNAGA